MKYPFDNWKPNKFLLLYSLLTMSLETRMEPSHWACWNTAAQRIHLPPEPDEHPLTVANLHKLDSTNLYKEDYRLKLRNQFRQFLQGMLQVGACPTMDCTVSCHVYHQSCGLPAVQLHPFNDDDDFDDYEYVYDSIVAPGSAAAAAAVAAGSVLVDVGQVDQQVATLWWALAQQTARVARRCAMNTTNNNPTPSPPSSRPMVDYTNVPTVGIGIQSYADASGGGEEAPMTSLTSRTKTTTARAHSLIFPERIEPSTAVGDLTLWQCNSSSCSDGSCRSSSSPATNNTSYNRIRSDSRSSIMATSTSTAMTSPRLVRELCQKFPPPPPIYAGGTPIYESYVYETPPKEGANGPVKLLRYVRVAQSASAENLPVASPTGSPTPATGTLGTDGTLRNSFRRPKSEMMLRKFSGNKPSSSSSSQPIRTEDISSSGECVQYESQDLGRDVDEVDNDPAASYSPIVVVAIDFGTTYSGYAFSFIHDPDDIHMMRKWEGGDPGIPNAKTPTVLLLKPSGVFHSFGYSARDFYHDLPARESRTWLYFDKFKMTLHHQKMLSRHTPIMAANGTDSLSAVTIFAHALRFFKEHALRELSDQTAIPIHNEDVRWVITVPAIWRSSAKQLMRQAAYEAGLGSDRLPQQILIALEPEAASLFCRQLKRHQLKPERPAELHLMPSNPSQPAPLKPWTTAATTNNTTTGTTKNLKRDSIYSDAVLEPVKFGQRYVVVDCGGGTVDITVHQAMDLDGQHLKELHRATGGPYGSIGVDLAFEQLLDNIFGADFMAHFKSRLPASHVDLMVAFEARKRHASPYRCNPLNIALPFSFIDCFRKYRGREVEFAIRKHGDPHVRWSTQGMLRLDQEAMKKLFQPTIRAIIEHIEDVLAHSDLNGGVDYLFLVGGFAESPLLQQAIRSHLSHYVTVIIPQDVSLAILKGAVLYGVNPRSITVRRSRLTYGVAVLNRFIYGRHPESKRVVKDGLDYCKDVFDKFVVADQSVSLGERVVRSYSPARRHQRRIVLNIFCADTEDVQFVTDPGVRMFATLSLDLGFTCAPKSRREIRVTMEFGDTEIRASAVDVMTGNVIKATFDFLDDQSSF